MSLHARIISLRLRAETREFRRGLNSTKRALKSAQRFDMRSARHAILAAANSGRDPIVDPYGMRQLQQAVFKCRQLRLVSDEVLTSAGFNASRP